MAEHEKFPVEVLTPEGEVFNDEVQMISTRTGTGSIGILANHTPLLAMLDPTELRLYKSDSDVISFAQGEGYLQMQNNHALLLVEDAVPPEDLDTSDLDEKLRKAEEAYEKAEEGSEERRVAARDKRRWEAFGKLASGGSSSSG
jgi:F-type H+-transporting ATPase subunit epsilon